jgi:hypothetical protein
MTEDSGFYASKLILLLTDLQKLQRILDLVLRLSSVISQSTHIYLLLKFVLQ